MKRLLTTATLLIATVTMIWAQGERTNNYIRCAFDEHHEMRQAENPKIQTRAQFEQWISAKIAEIKANPDNARRAAYRIPYVIHVIHKGEAVGSGTNLSQAICDEQFSQINDDFRRENADVGNTPAMFELVAAAFDVEFVPAVVDPDGNILDEPGIHRVDGIAEFGVGTWGSGSMDGTCKPATIWDPSRYMNVWSADLSGGLLGYAQFPEGSTLPGMPVSGENPLTDGVVCLYSSIGGLDLPGTATPFHLGRTLTHELGHWIGLLHTFSSGCGAPGDYCDDTPSTSSSNFGCPTGQSTCGSTDMPENYMDYSDDACFNLFTLDQVDRMIAVMENSIRRNELLTSTVWQFPSADTIIAGIDCDITAGCAPLTVNFSDDSYVADSADAIISWVWNFDVGGLGGVTPPNSTDQNPGAVVYANPGVYTVMLTIDNGTYSNSATKTVTVEGSESLDVVEDFEAGLPDWTNDTWLAGAPGFESSGSMYQRNWTNSGRTPAFINTPSMDVDVTADELLLTFDVSHANYSLTGLGADEGMAIEVSNDCGESWVEVWKKLDSDDPPFYTVENTSSSWVPGADEWRAEEVDLTSYLGGSPLRVRFHGISDYGNDTYVDNIELRAITVDPNDIFAEFEADPTEGCQGLEVTFTDLSLAGSATEITSWEWDFDLSGVGGASPATSSDEAPGTVTFSVGGSYTVQLIVSDGATSDTAWATIEVEGSDAPPILEDFEAGIPPTWENDTWLPGAPGYQSSGSLFQDNYNNAGEIPAFLTTTSVDLSGPADEATLSFDVAHTYYTPFGPEDEGLAVEVSLDCGETWFEIWRKLDSDDDPFYTVEGGSTPAWFPTSDDDWRAEEIDIIDGTGNASVKFRFIGISAYGNNTFVDNINITTRVVDPNTIEAEFEAEPLVICEGQTVSFEDLSLIGSAITGTTWDWDFDATGVGSTDPATFSGQEPPAVVFETAGFYTVELTVSGEGTAGSVSNSYSLEIEVEGSAQLPTAEDFEGAFPPAGWGVLDFIAAPVGFQSNTSAFADNYNNANLRADMTLQSLDFTAVGRAELTFDLSHTFYQSIFGNFYDTLAIAYSLDCGETWTELWRKDDGDPLNPLYTVPGTGASFVPVSDADWRAESVDVTFLQGYGNVRLRFENRGAFGNGLFLDNINIDAELVEPDEVFAYFTVEGSAGCVGNAINFIESSTAGVNTSITSWEWDFDGTGIGGADPSTYSGENPPAVTFNTPGDYEITLTVSDGDVSDDYTVTLSVGASEDLGFAENFASATFPPPGWTNLLWGQAAESSDALLGSLWADNYFIVNHKANAWTPPLDMSWYDQITLEFDVAHSRFSTAENEGLVISGSSDCGASFDEVWSKYDFDGDPLHTTTDLNTAAWFPEGPEDWREEIVDLSSFNDYNAVRVEFFNDGFYGNNTFVDDINISGIIFTPTELTAAVAGGNNIELSWTDNSDKEEGYEVQRWNDGSGMFETIAMVGADEEAYTDENLSGPMRYVYQVCAYNEMARACGNTATDSVGSVLFVDGLIAILVDEVGTSIELFWNDGSTTEDGYYVKRSTDGVNFTIINVLTPDHEYYIDEFLDETVTYYYQVCAFNDEDVAESNIAFETTNINAPTDLIVTPDYNNLVLTWTDNSLVEDGFQIKRSDTPGGPYQTIAVVPFNVTTYTDFVLEENTTYYYIVCAYNDIDVACSNEGSNTTDLANSLFDDLSSVIGLYPNPANNFVDIELSGVQGEVHIKVFNQIGDLMLMDEVIGGAVRRIELNDFAGGIYMIMMRTDDGFTTKKLVVE